VYMGLAGWAVNQEIRSLDVALFERIESIKAQVEEKCDGFKPEVAIILGTGLGGLVNLIEEVGAIDYDEIEGMPNSTVVTHKGRLVLGRLGGKNVITMDGRFHVYEGHSLEDVTIGVRVAKAMGAEILVVSNAAGGLNPEFAAGDVILIEDHINLMGCNPLIGVNDERLGPQFPDMIEPYSRKLIEVAEAVALEKGIKTHRGVYAAMTGPCLETRAEYRYLQTIGADVIGMSTVPEVIVAVHAGLKVLGLSIVTDMCLPDALKPVNIDEIIATAGKAEVKLTAIVQETLARI